MIVLAIDTALNGCGVAVFAPDRGFLAQAVAPMTRGHAEALLPLVNDILAQAGMTYAELSLIAATIGPGAFTGLRIGLATTQALGLALGLPVAGVTTTSILAAQFQQMQGLAPEETLAVVLETKRTDFYVEFFGAHAAPPIALPAADLFSAINGLVRVIGDASPRLTAAGPPKNWTLQEGFAHPDPGMLAALAWNDFQIGRIGAAQPLYLRPPDVTASKKPQRRLAE